MNNDEIILKDGNFIRRSIAEVNLGSQDQLLASLVEQVPVMLPNFMNHGGAGVHVLISKNHVVLATQLSHLPFTTWWMAGGGARAGGSMLMPVWAQQRGAIKIEDKFPVPAAWGQALFAQKFDRESVTSLPGLMPSTCSLYLYREKELYFMQYPNNYADGRLCMGPEFDAAIRGKRHDCATHFAQALASFWSTEMNNHLVTEHTLETYKRNLDGWVIDDNRAARFARCSVAYMAGFTL